METVIVEKVSKKFRIGFRKRQGILERVVSQVSGREPKRSFWALKDITFTAKVGEIVGIIGENGSGKSTLLRIIAGIYEQDKGRVETKGNIVSLIGLYAGLQLRLTMKDNIYLCCSLFGLDQKTIDKRFDSIVAFTELEKFLNTKIYQCSTGMLQRLAFSIGIHCNPEILLLDEVFEVGDEDFRKKSSAEIGKLAKDRTAVILASHETTIIEKYCNHVIWIERGKIVRKGDPKRVVGEYLQSTTS